ncbi:hypothetical protein G647_03277 [Cladophialophora carrionii CBS 160.54]|uniref:Uncharacterized protein n=1 Tax=Cladophialophora carrionii CBS 160.54 TaxID=1279043 RepID=V9DI14_9EURO|nr:uncharacterized protein G647_03277 [Cladophialophora carrionii CBS 160.54]ETI26500.1 hypothetical protein G647_03277 [Cladophialophora carrionii CBS 160.54]
MSSNSKKPWESKKWDSLGYPINKHPNRTYHYPSRTEFDSNTGTYNAHPSYSNDRAARDREAATSSGRDFAYSSKDPRHESSQNHGPRTNDQAARDREAAKSVGRDFAYSTKSSRHWDSKTGR